MKHSEPVMNERMKTAGVTSIGAQINIWWSYLYEEVERGKIQEAIKKLKAGKAPGIDGITAETLKYGGYVFLEWVMWICN